MNNVYIITTRNIDNVHGPIFLDPIPKHGSISLESIFVSQFGINWENVLRFDMIDHLPVDATKLVLNINHLPTNNEIYINKKQVKKINRSKNTYLWLFSPWEATLKENDLMEQINKSPIANNKVIVTTSAREYHGRIINGVRFVSITDWWEGQYRHHLKHFSNVSFLRPQIEKQMLSDATKKYICLNRNLKHHRVWTYYFLLSNNMISDGHVSFHLPSCAKEEPWLDYNHFVERSLYNIKGNEFKDLRERLFQDKKLDNLDTNRIINYDVSITPFYKDSLFSIVTESLLEQDFVTEKTFKAMMHCHPFVTIGSKKTAERLRHKGYETFEDIFGIDAIETPDELNKFLAHVKSYTLAEWKDKILSVWPKVEHNWTHFLNSTNPFEHFTTELKRMLNEK